jgi:mRNA interferase HigB
LRIISHKAIRQAAAEHTEWAASFDAWYKIARLANWTNFEQVRKDWKNSDKVGRFVVFDISHNRCRLICTIRYDWKVIYIRGILSHAEYDRKGWQQE